MANLVASGNLGIRTEHLDPHPKKTLLDLNVKPKIFKTYKRRRPKTLTNKTPNNSTNETPLEKQTEKPKRTLKNTPVGPSWLSESDEEIWFNDFVDSPLTEPEKDDQIIVSPWRVPFYTRVTSPNWTPSPLPTPPPTPPTPHLSPPSTPKYEYFPRPDFSDFW